MNDLSNSHNFYHLFCHAKRQRKYIFYHFSLSLLAGSLFAFRVFYHLGKALTNIGLLWAMYDFHQPITLFLAPLIFVDIVYACRSFASRFPSGALFHWLIEQLRRRFMISFCVFENEINSQLRGGRRKGDFVSGASE
jgi:hypothetical protein